MAVTLFTLFRLHQKTKRKTEYNIKHYILNRREKQKIKQLKKNCDKTVFVSNATEDSKQQNRGCWYCTQDCFFQIVWENHIY